MSRQLKLKDIINKINWVKIETTRGFFGMPADAVVVGFFKSTAKGSTKVDECRLRLGKTVLDELKWQAGDKINIMHDPDDVMSFLLVKSEGGNGRTLSQESGSPHCRMTFKWEQPVPLNIIPSHAVEYDIYKNHLGFRVNLPSNDE